MRRPTLALIPVVVIALVAAGCGSSKKTSTTSTTASKPASTARTSTVAVKHTGLGTILVDSSGRTLYLFEKDKGDKSACSGACASAWPPLTTTAKPTTATGVTASLLGTTKRSDGKTEVTYHGHPLYTYVGDGAPGQTSGEGLNQFGAEWYVLSPQGNKVEKSGS
jgi:predicted lipoprotein with Yx(FWY)xxD motif